MVVSTDNSQSESVLQALRSFNKEGYGEAVAVVSYAISLLPAKINTRASMIKPSLHRSCSTIKSATAINHSRQSKHSVEHSHSNLLQISIYVYHSATSRYCFGLYIIRTYLIKYLNYNHQTCSVTVKSSTCK